MPTNNSSAKCEFQTSDMIEIQALLYFGLEPMTIKPDSMGGQRKVFIFKKSKELEEILTRLSGGKLLVEPVRFVSAQKILKQKLKYFV